MDLKVEHPYHIPPAEVIVGLNGNEDGLTGAESARRLQSVGPNTLPEAQKDSIWLILARQFLDPLIYVLLFAALLSLVIGKIADTVFIMVVLMLNAAIGAVQERSAQRSAESLQRMVSAKARVLRDGHTQVVEARELVPGDVVLLESGDKVPADMRLIHSHELQVDESLLTGESLPEEKDHKLILSRETTVADQDNMVFSGTLVVRGRARAVVTATGLATQLGRIATDVLQGEKAKPPLIQRMERFTWWLTLMMLLAAVLLAMLMVLQSYSLLEVLLVVAALAVAAIPEGLPVAITIALSVSMRRMAKRHVIARRLVTVEALGSCTFIASDKTGTLTRNQITLEKISFPQDWQATIMDGISEEEDEAGVTGEQHWKEHWPQLRELLEAGVLANEAELKHRGDKWVKHGDSADLAFLSAAQCWGISQEKLYLDLPRQALIPFESVKRFGAAMHLKSDQPWVYVKGALETVLPMCSRMKTGNTDIPKDETRIQKQAHDLASEGFRVLALAMGPVQSPETFLSRDRQFTDLHFLGLAGMIDPLREESAGAVKQCQDAGIHVAMVTGDHPVTSLAIGRKLGLLQDESQVVTGSQLMSEDPSTLKSLLGHARVYARMEPHQKLSVVNALQDQGHFVAVTGDGANDAPALKAAHVGVAMGQAGTDVARETADMIITDDNFSSIVAGIEEGRIAYNNVRKVIHLLISTGMGEIVLFFFAILLGMPIPLTAVQLLWLNLVTNGIQDVALAFEPGEGDELTHPPRKPEESIFNRVMIQRVVLAALVMGVVACFCFYSLLQQGMSVEAARNGTLFLMVLFENIHVFNSRSETQSVFFHNPLRNKLLLFGTVTAQLIHLAAMHTPGLREILVVQAITLGDYLYYLSLALSLLAASELYKFARFLIKKTHRHKTN